MASLAVITAVPSFVSAEEHRNIIASTPSSFSDIPPILRHKEENVSVTLDPLLDAFTAQDAADGVLYIIESALVYMSSTGRGFEVKYPTITLHAISRAEGSSPSIYCQLDEGDGRSPPDEESEDVTEMRELIIVPKNPDSLDAIFEAMSTCAALHPDPNMSEDDEADNDAFISPDQFQPFTGDEEQELSEVGRAALEYLESIIEDPFHSQNEINGNLEDAEQDSDEREELEE